MQKMGKMCRESTQARLFGCNVGSSSSGGREPTLANAASSCCPGLNGDMRTVSLKLQFKGVNGKDASLASTE